MIEILNDFSTIIHNQRKWTDLHHLENIPRHLSLCCRRAQIGQGLDQIGDDVQQVYKCHRHYHSQSSIKADCS